MKYDNLADLFESPDGVYFKPKEKQHVTTKDERMIEQFDEIVKFYHQNERLPLSNPGAPLREKLLYKRLTNYRTDPKKRAVLEPIDELGLLDQEEVAPANLDELFAKDDWLFQGDNGLFEVEKLPNKGRSDRSKGEVASRKKCDDFQDFEALFKEKQTGLANKQYKLIGFRGQNFISVNCFYIVDGMMCYVAERGEKKMTFGRPKERLRVIFENGTESNMFLRTLSSQLYYGGFEVVDKDFKDTPVAKTGKTAGRIYVLKSKSTDDRIRTIKNFYKIGQTAGSVEERIKNAKQDPTYLMAPVEIVQTYRLTGDYNPRKVEDLLHRFFADAKVDLAIIDKNGKEYVPDEWYSVPLGAIEEAIDLLNSGEIVDYIYQDGEIVEVDILQ